MLLTGAIVPLDHEIAAAVDDVWSALGRPGRWLSGAERVALAAECRAAAAGRRGDDPLLDDHRRDLVARIVHDPAGLHDLADDELLGDLLVDEYVELAAVASKVVAVDHLVAGLGARTLPLPTPLPGEPTRVRPAGAADLGARVPMLTPDQLADEIGPGTYHVNVRRAHSLVPEEAAQQIRLVEACYVPDLLAHGLEGRRGLQRAQIEALATRVSSLNRCFYCSAGHALLLTASGAEDGADVVGASQGGDAGIDHGIELLALADAMVRDQPPLVEARAACAAVLDDTQLLGAVATVAAFVLLNRVADTSGIALDAMAAGALDALPAELGLDAAPGARRTGEV